MSGPFLEHRRFAGNSDLIRLHFSRISATWFRLVLCIAVLSANSPLTATPASAAIEDGIQFSIRPRTNLALGTVITNQAGIIFDTNAPILTNLTTNTIGVIVSPTTLLIDGPILGQVGVSQTLTAMVSPISTTLPISYIWQATNQTPITNSADLSDTVSFTWNITGTQAVTVTAISPVETVTDSHLILISETPLGQNDLALRFYGHGVNDIDRVKIAIDPQVPVDVGGDFTLEFWLKANLADNISTPDQPCGGSNWIYGNILLDRDVFGNGDYGDFGLSIYQGTLRFGVGDTTSDQTICGATIVADGQWHHVAATRRSSDGQLRLYLDGQLEAEGLGPSGDISYRDGRPTSYPNSDPFLVIGAEKHDAGAGFPSYNGWLDEVRVSTMIRYTTTFTRPNTSFSNDGNTVALYHFDEGPPGPCTALILDSSGAAGGPSHGACQFGGAGLAGPVYSLDTPFAAVTAPVTPLLSIAAAGPDIVLTWTDGPANTAYEVYRSNMPFFNPLSSTLLITLPTATTVYTDPGVTGVVSTSHFYQVRALGNGGQTADSHEVGEIDLALNNDSGMYSLISLPFSTTTITDAASLASYIGDVGALLKWNPTTQAFRFFVPPSTGDNFSVAPGEVVFVQVNSGGPSVVTMVGDVTAVQHSLVPGGFNFISLPLQRADLTDAGEVAADITNVDAMLRWNEATQTFRFFVPPGSGDNFPLRVGTPFVIDLAPTGPALWP